MKLKSSFVLALISTVFVACAQILLKTTANTSKSILSIFINQFFILALICLGVAFLFLTLALRKGKISQTYPVMALGYVWVSIFSLLFFSESFSVAKISGTFLVIIGVSLLGVKK